MEETGFCWECGRQLVRGIFCEIKNPKAKNKPKCEEKWKRKQARQIIIGKRAAYGIKGDTH